MAQPKVTKKSSRQNRNNQSERPQSEAISDLDKHASDAPMNGEGKAHTSSAVPALLTDPHTDTNAQSYRKPETMALIPRPAAANAAGTTKRKSSAFVGMLLASVCLIGAAIFLFDTSKASRNDMQIAQSNTAASLITPAPESGAGSHAAHNAPSSAKRAAATRAKRDAAKPTVTASKTDSATPRSERKIAQAPTKQGAPPIAGNVKKKPASAIAKAPKNVPKDKSMPLLAQNSASTSSKANGAQDDYAQCREIGNFFRREQCKWEVCNGKWGQDGCPSYAGDNREVH